ncbi:MAG: MBL fold metallo-hydrolase [Deltaproteobacteria bacterium]|nr:MBL fold metallo-hydrolase [Deltaproteobacteria bacterium]
MKVVILGCGTSTGVPVIGCKCGVRTSENPKNKRTRASVLIATNERNILMDASTDIRLQALTYQLNRIDAVLFTHAYADHILGIDELRSFNLLQKGPIPCYGDDLTIQRLKKMFDYIFTSDINNSWRPDIETFTISAPFELFGVTIEPVEVYHGKLKILGYRLGGLAYVTDCSFIPEESSNGLLGLDVLILGALRHKPHPTHYNIQEALKVVERLKPKRAIFTHLGHNLDYNETNNTLPDGVELAYDGMEVTIRDDQVSINN